MITNPSPEKKYRTRDGRKAEVYAVKEWQKFCVFGAVGEANNVWSQLTWMMNGRLSDRDDSICDLVEVKEEVRYIDCFSSTEHSVWSDGLAEKPYSGEAANHVGTVKLTFEDGKLISAEVITERSNDPQAADDKNLEEVTGEKL